MEILTSKFGLQDSNVCQTVYHYTAVESRVPDTGSLSLKCKFKFRIFSPFIRIQFLIWAS